VREIGEGDIKKFTVGIRNDPKLVVLSVERDRMTDKDNERYFECDVRNAEISMVRDESGAFKSASIYNRKTGQGLLSIPTEYHYLAIKKALDEEQAKLVKEPRIR